MTFNELRLRAGLRQVEISRRSGVGLASIYLACNGKGVGIFTAYKLAKVVGVDNPMDIDGLVKQKSPHETQEQKNNA